VASISDVKRFKDIDESDNILVKELDEFKKVTPPEISNKLLDYIDIEGELLNALANRAVFFDTFLSRGVSPYLRMACDVEILDDAQKTVKLVQRPLSANGKLRYENLDVKYMDKAILEVYIESFPAEVTDRSQWRIERIDTPISLLFRKNKLAANYESYVYLSELSFERPMKFFYGDFLGKKVWSPMKDTFKGRVELYGATTGIDGYEDVSALSKDDYLRFIDSSSDLTVLEKVISRAKTVNLKDNNISTKRYAETSSSAPELKMLQGNDLELGVSDSTTTGKGVNSLGVKLLKKPEPAEVINPGPISMEIGEIIYTFNKAKFGLDEFEEGVYLCSTLTNATVYNSSDFPEFVTKFNITDPTFVVRDILYKKENPTGLAETHFNKFTLNYTPLASEIGKVVHGRFNAFSDITVYAADTTLHFSDKEDLLPYPANKVTNEIINPILVKPVSDDSPGVYISNLTNPSDVWEYSQSSYYPGTLSVTVKDKKPTGNTDNAILGETLTEESVGVIWYVILGFKPV
jgi:hypothetical protein